METANACGCYGDKVTWLLACNQSFAHATVAMEHLGCKALVCWWEKLSKFASKAFVPKNQPFRTSSFTVAFRSILQYICYLRKGSCLWSDIMSTMMTFLGSISPFRMLIMTSLHSLSRRLFEPQRIYHLMANDIKVFFGQFQGFYCLLVRQFVISLLSRTKFFCKWPKMSICCFLTFMRSTF